MGAVATAQRLLWRLNVALMVVLALTGMYLALFYRADPIDAYGSALRVQNAILVGRLARALHWHAANILIATALLHVLSLAITARQPAPAPSRSLLVVFVLVLAAVTGTVLPWDQAAYWSTQRVLFLVGTIPVLGPLLVGEGIPEVSPGFLHSAWQFHVFVVPTIGALIWLYYSTRGKDDRYAPGG